MQDICAQQTPAELPGVTADRVIIGQRPADHSFLAQGLGETPDAAQGRRIAEQVGLFALLLIGPVADEQQLVAVILRRHQVLGEPAGEQLAGRGGQMAEQAGRLPVVDQHDDLEVGQIAARRQHPAVFNLDTVPARHMRKFHGAETHLLGRVGRLKRIGFGRQIRNGRVPRGVGRKINPRQLFFGQLRDEPPGSGVV